MAYKGPRGSGFVGLQQYLGLNREAGERMGGDFASQVEREGQAAMSGVDAASAAYNNAAGVGITYDPNSNVPGAMANVDRANRVLGATPGAFGSDALALQAANAQRTARMAGSEVGRQTLLRQQYGQNAPYSQGASMLDAALAGRGGGQRLDKAAGGFSRLREYLGTAQSTAEGQAADAKKRAGEALGQAGAYLTTASPLGTPVQPRPQGSTEVPEHLRAPEKKDTWMNKAGRWMFRGG